MLDIIILPPPMVMAAAFAALGSNLKSFHEPLLRSVREVMTKSLSTNFAVGGRPSWEPLTEDTVKRGGNDILVRTGALRSAAGQINLWTIGKEDAKASGGPFYGGIHQNGWSSGPARPWALIQPQDEQAIEDVFDKWLTERLMAAGWF